MLYTAGLGKPKQSYVCLMGFAAGSRAAWQLCQSPFQCCVLLAEKPAPPGPPVCVLCMVGCPWASSGHWLLQSAEQGRVRGSLKCAAATWRWK